MGHRGLKSVTEELGGCELPTCGSATLFVESEVLRVGSNPLQILCGRTQFASEAAAHIKALLTLFRLKQRFMAHTCCPPVFERCSLHSRAAVLSSVTHLSMKASLATAFATATVTAHLSVEKFLASPVKRSRFPSLVTALALREKRGRERWWSACQLTTNLKTDTPHASFFSFSSHLIIDVHHTALAQVSVCARHSILMSSMMSV